MDQGIIATLKKNYKANLLKEMVMTTSQQECEKFMKEIDILKVIILIAETWDSLAETTLQRSWSKLYASPDINNDQSETVDIRSILAAISPEANFGADINAWLDDENEPGYEHLDENQIIQSVTDDEPDEESEPEEEPIEIICQNERPSNADAYKAFTVCLEWLQQQPEASVYNTSLLRNLRGLAASLRFQAFRQPKITSFFNK